MPGFVSSLRALLAGQDTTDRPLAPGFRGAARTLAALVSLCFGDCASQMALLTARAGMLTKAMGKAAYKVFWRKADQE